MDVPLNAQQQCDTANPEPSRVESYFAARLFRAILVMTGILVVVLVVYDQHTGQAVKGLKERYNRFEKLRSDIIYFDEALTTSARMAVVTGDSKWEKRYQELEPKLTAILQQAFILSPEIYRQEMDRTHSDKIKLLQMEQKAFDFIRAKRSQEAIDILFGDQYEIEKENYAKAVEWLNVLLKKQIDAALAVVNSKEHLARVSLMSTLILLLMSWLIIIRMTRRFQQALMATNDQLRQRTRELDELTHTLEERVKERTSRLAQALEDLKNAQMQLLQSEKFAAVGQLAAGVAHEINNPIGFINSNLQTLEQYVAHYTKLLGILNQLDKVLKDKDQQQAAQVVASWDKIRKETNFTFIGDDIGNLLKESKDGAEKIRKIVLDLRAFASPDKGMMESVNVEGLMESMLNIVWNEIKYKADLRKSYGDVPLLTCNPQKIGQVFVNLLLNAAQAIEGNKGVITIKTYAKDEYVCVDICDTGCGISPDDATKIFDPFFTTKPVGSGVGLGLSISYDIVRKHGGTLTFTSQVGKGTMFTVMLPAECAAVVKEKRL